MLGAAILVALLSFHLPSVAGGHSSEPGSTVDTDLVISNKVVKPDGVSRVAVLAGGTFPGPPIRATRGHRGANFKINVIDQLTDTSMLRSTSIHWHGIFQRGTNWADGAAFITQCPITPGHSFQYEFTVPDQVGTFWYHSHLSTQYCDGLRGAFVIYNPDDPYKRDYDVDDENTIITLADWYHLPSPLEAQNPPPVSKATIINGKGRAINGTAVDLSVVNVQHGKRYRFRLIAMSCDTFFIFSIDNHDLTIIEADGEYTEKLVVDSITIYAGQRYSVIMKADKPISNYWIRANSDFRSFPGFDGGRNSAILRYQGARKVEPTTTFVESRKPLKEINLHAKFDAEAPGKAHIGGADVNLNIAHRFNPDTFMFEMNGVSFVPPTAPVLLQILSGTQRAQDLLPKGSVYSLPPNKVIELSLPGTGIDQSGPHPFHLHGHSFHVVRSGDSPTYNYKNPVRRDTVNTGLEDGNATIRFKTDNAGPWFLHCHVDWHLDVGLAVVFAEDTENAKQANLPVPQAWGKLCPTYDALPPETPGTTR